VYFFTSACYRSQLKIDRKFLFLIPTSIGGG
jgi:hypothetical protein